MSKPVTVSDLTQQIDPHDIEPMARDRFLSKEAKRRSFEKGLIRFLPVAFLIMAGIFFALSAPHTAEIMNLLVPHIGYAAPVGFELGIIVLAALIEAGWRKRTTRGLLYALILMAIAINIVGGFMSIVKNGALFLGVNSDVVSMNAGELVARFTELPFSFQAAMLMAVPLGVLIPISGYVFGEGIVRLALGRIVLATESDEQVWAKHAAEVMHQALIAEAMRRGASVSVAGKFATMVVEQFYRYKPQQVELSREPVRASVARPTLPATPAPAASPTLHLEERRPMGFVPPAAGQPGQQDRTGQPGHVPPPVPSRALAAPSFEREGTAGQVGTLDRTDVLSWLQDNIARIEGLSDKQVCRLYTQERFGTASDAGYKTINRARKQLQL